MTFDELYNWAVESKLIQEMEHPGAEANDKSYHNLQFNEWIRERYPNQPIATGYTQKHFKRYLRESNSFSSVRIFFSALIKRVKVATKIVMKMMSNPTWSIVFGAIILGVLYKIYNLLF